MFITVRVLSYEDDDDVCTPKSSGYTILIELTLDLVFIWAASRLMFEN